MSNANAFAMEAANHRKSASGSLKPSKYRAGPNDAAAAALGDNMPPWDQKEDETLQGQFVKLHEAAISTWSDKRSTSSGEDRLFHKSPYHFEAWAGAPTTGGAPKSASGSNRTTLSPSSPSLLRQGSSGGDHKASRTPSPLKAGWKVSAFGAEYAEAAGGRKRLARPKLRNVYINPKLASPTTSSYAAINKRVKDQVQKQLGFVKGNFPSINYNT